MRIRILCEGRTKDEHLSALQAGYVARIRHFVNLEIEEIRAAGAAAKNNRLSAAERRLLEKTSSERRVVLDERGEPWTSEHLAQWLGGKASEGAQEVAFLVGGPAGFSQEFREHAGAMLALSRMTLTRDWARTLLLEQIYRAFAILRGYPYPR